MVKPFAKLTAIQNVMVSRIYGRDSARSLKQSKVESSEILDYVGLGDRGHVIASSLTLADRKRLELGRVLASKPRLILLDELMSGLNPVEIEAAMQLIQNVRDSGITVIMVEHIVKAVLGISNKIVVLSAGEKIAEGTSQKIARDQQVIAAYLGEESYA